MPNPTQPTDLTALARECAEKIVKLTGFGHALHVNDIAPDIAATLRPVVAERDQLRAEVELLKDYEVNYETLTWLLRNRFKMKDGIMPDYKVEDVLTENDQLRATLDAAEGALKEAFETLGNLGRFDEQLERIDQALARIAELKK